MYKQDEKSYTQNQSNSGADEPIKTADEPIKTIEEKILLVLRYIGFIGAVITTMAYVAVIVVLIMGFNKHTITQTITFAVLNAVIGLLIAQFLKIQGISFAKAIPKNKKLLEDYYNTKTRDKKVRSIKYYWAVSLTKDILSKGLTVAFFTAGMIYIVIEASNDAALLLMATANLLMFMCFGLLAMNSSYEFFNTRHMQYITERISEAKKMGGGEDV